MKLRRTSALLILISIAVMASGAQAGGWVDGTPRFHEKAVLLARTLGHDSMAMLAPGIADEAVPKPAYAAGDERDFYANNMATGAQYLLTASCRAVSGRAYIFVENGTAADAGKVGALLTNFDGIYDSLTGQFGPPPDSVDNDPRIYILILDIVDNAGADGSQVIGYFDPLNQYRNEELPRWNRETSNEVELLYIDYKLLGANPNGAEDIVAHEFTHLIQWARDPLEETWIDEGIAVYAEVMLGYTVEHFITAFEENPDTPLLIWSDVLADYGAAYIFFTYISEKFGGAAVIAAVVKNGDQGTAGIEQSLAAQGKVVSFPDLFSDWVIANYLDKPDLNGGIYGYTTLDIHLKPSVVESLYPVTSKTSAVSPWAAHYIEFEKGQDKSLNLTVSGNGWWDDIAAQVIEYGNEIYVSSFKSDAAASGSSIIPKGSQKAVLVVTSQPNPPEAGRRSSMYAYSAETVAENISVTPVAGTKITTWGAIRRD